MKKKKRLPSEIRLPELNIPPQYDKFFNFAKRIKARYWLVILTAFLAGALAIMPHYLLAYFWKGLVTQKTPVTMLLIFSLLALSLAWSTGQRIDVWIFLHFNIRGDRPKWLDYAMLCFTQLGNGLVAMLIAVTLFLGVDHMLAYELVVGTLTLWMVVSFIKAVIRRARPFIRLPGIRIVGVREKGTSFPSGHTSQAFFMATLLLNYFKVDLCMHIVFYTAAVLVGVTRIYVGMHYPRDVTAGAILGTAWSFIGVAVNAAVFGTLLPQ